MPVISGNVGLKGLRIPELSGAMTGPVGPHHNTLHALCAAAPVQPNRPAGAGR